MTAYKNGDALVHRRDGTLGLFTRESSTKFGWCYMQMGQGGPFRHVKTTSLRPATPAEVKAEIPGVGCTVILLDGTRVEACDLEGDEE
jgi:hypothetical protein